jgi:GST-like protein
MIDLYASTTPNVMKVTLALVELDLDFRFLPVNVWKGEQFADDFVRRNPNSKVPVLVDNGAPGGPVTVFESVAILIYLAEKTGKLLPKGGAARYDVLQWAVWQAANFGPANGQFNHFETYAPGEHAYSKSRYTTELRRLYGVLERRLASTAYVGGDEFSIADLATFPWVLSAHNRLKDKYSFLNQDAPEHPAIAAWFARCKARPAIQRGIERHAEVKSMLATAEPDDLDRIFGRGKYAYKG